MIAGAMMTLRIGDPALLDTDIGPVIDAEARATLEAHIAWLENNARQLCAIKLGEETGNGHFVGPVAYEIDSISVLDSENLGAILHGGRYKPADMAAGVAGLNETGPGTKKNG